MHKFLVVVEKTTNNYSAHSPDLPGGLDAEGNAEGAERGAEPRHQFLTLGEILPR